MPASGDEGRERVEPEGTGGPVSLPRDSNTRRIKTAGNQTFQYPCSCRIYAIKRPPTPSLHGVSFSPPPPPSRPPAPSFSLTLFPVVRRVRTLFPSAVMLHIRLRWARCRGVSAGARRGYRARFPPLTLIQFNIIDVRMCRAI